MMKRHWDGAYNSSSSKRISSRSAAGEDTVFSIYAPTHGPLSASLSRNDNIGESHTFDGSYAAMDMENNERVVPKPKKRSYKDWVKERTFPNLAEAERAVYEEGCWSYRFKNHTCEGIKKYYECKFGKRRRKKCAQELHLMLDSSSHEVHLFRTNREHTHYTGNKRAEVATQRQPPPLTPRVVPRSFANETPSTSTMPQMAPMPNLAIIKAESIDGPFDVQDQQEDCSEDESAELDYENNQVVAGRGKKIHRNWVQEAIFSCEQEALNYIRNEGCWGFRFSNTTSDGFKNYFRCNLTRTRGKQCAQEIYLFFEKNSQRVHLYRTDREHTHSSIVQEYQSNKEQMQQGLWYNEPSTSQASQNVEQYQPDQPIKIEILDSSSDESNHEGFDASNIPSISDFLYEPQTIITQERPRMRNSVQKNWVKEKTFKCAEDAEYKLKEEGCWSYRFKNNTSEGAKKYFRCNRAKRRGTQCAQEVHLLYENKSNKVHLYRTDSDHTHSDIGAPGIGMPPLVKEEITLMYRNNVQRASDIYHILSQNPHPNMPSLRQISNFLVYLRKKEEECRQPERSFDDVVIKVEPQSDCIQLFSSGDLSSECEDGGEVKDDGTPGARPAPLQQQPLPTGGPPNIPPPPAPGTAGGPPISAGANAPELSLSFGKGPARGTSAPSSPAKSRESLLQRVQSLTGAARDQGASIIGAAVSSATRPAFNKDRCLTLLVLDDQNTDWSKYFRGKRLHGDYDIRVEQAEFREISLTANVETGTVVTMAVVRGGTKVARSFKPDFVLVRQPPRDGSRDNRSTLLGLKYGNVPSINSLSSLYQFQDKPWVFAHLLQLQKRLGRDIFPLIEQTFFPNPRELFSWQKFPCVLKAGHCHGGTATARLDNQTALQDSAGLLCGSGNSTDSQCYCTLEPYIDAKFDIHIQKIGGNYKAFMRKSISGHWKTNQGSAMLEQISMTDRYKHWIDEISELFGGMEVCGLSVGVAKDGKEFILSAQDSTFPLMGDSQEEDRRHIADLVVGRMQNVCRPPGMSKAQSRTSISSRSGSAGGSPTDETAGGVLGTRSAPPGAPPPIPERQTPGVGSIARHGSLSSTSDIPDQPTEKAPTLSSAASRRDSQTSQTSNVSGTSAPSRAGQRPQSQSSVVEDAEDTMKNLRKTFAGIFGDM